MYMLMYMYMRIAKEEATQHLCSLVCAAPNHDGHGRLHLVEENEPAGRLLFGQLVAPMLFQQLLRLCKRAAFGLHVMCRFVV